MKFSSRTIPNPIGVRNGFSKIVDWGMQINQDPFRAEQEAVPSLRTNDDYVAQFLKYNFYNLHGEIS
jgi:hypothetical protein